jgi:hypothetical protein
MTSSLKRWQVIVFLCFILPLLACNCSPEEFINAIDMNSDVVQSGMDPDDLLCMEVFIQFGYSNYDAYQFCSLSHECVWSAQVASDMPTPEEVRQACEEQGLPLQSTPAPSNIVAQQAPPQPRVDCSAFRLTSPLDGLPNGVATFYWDPLPGATGYSVGVYGEGGGATFGAGAGSTSTAGDVSQGAIGGGFSFTVQATAFMNGQAVCSHSVTLYRESSGGEAPNNSNGGDRSETAPELGPCGIRGCISIPTPVPPVILY